MPYDPIDLDDGVMLSPVVDVVVQDVNTGEISRIPLPVFQWLETLPKATAMQIVEAWYAGEN